MVQINALNFLLEKDLGEQEESSGIRGGWCGSVIISLGMSLVISGSVLVKKSMEGEERLVSSIIQGIIGKQFRGSCCKPMKCPLE